MEHQSGRRKFIKKSAASAAAIGLSWSGFASYAIAFDEKQNKSGIINPLMGSVGFEQSPLPYAFDALEDIIDAQTMELHYTKHAAAYAKALNEAAKAEGVIMTKPLEDVLMNITRYSAKMRNNAGGHYNHELFWKMMRVKKEDNKPVGKLKADIETSFGSFEKFKDKFEEIAKTRFGSGWAWLFVDRNKGLKIGSTPNQDNPLMDVSDIKGTPILGLDVWEHAYYLKYQNRRADYVNNWWKLVNWDYVEQRYSDI